MLIGKPRDVKSSEITDRRNYLNRRTLLRRTAILAGTAAATALAYRALSPPPPSAVRGQSLAGGTLEIIKPTGPEALASGFRTDEELTPFEDVTTYNNFYEFGTEKHDPARNAAGFVTRPWTVEIGGLVSKPATFDIDDLERLAPLEERIYRMRCVEAWSMVIPWLGLPLAKVLERVQPLSSAKFVAFETLYDPQRMPGQREPVLAWPYVEGLRIDEAMHPLTVLAVGLYGERLLPQNGAPLRLVVPWKYGFKGIKSIVKITLVSHQPPTSWSLQNPAWYGFYSNVNPTVHRQRWRQDEERRIGDFLPRPTLMFNGYGEQVAHLYAGMDLAREY